MRTRLKPIKLGYEYEIKGKISEDFHKYVGSKNGNFYYNFYLDGIYGLVLDIGEDHDDDYWEYYETANYDKYRQEQIDLLKSEVENKNFDIFQKGVVRE